MKRQWIIIDLSDGEHRINLAQVKEIKVDRTRQVITFRFMDGKTRSVAPEGSDLAGSYLKVTTAKFKDILQQLPDI